MATIRFFAIDEDLTSVIESVEQRYSLHYVETGNFLNEAARTPLSLQEVVERGPEDQRSAVACPGYLSAPRDMPFEPRQIVGVEGAVRTLFDQLANPDSVVFRAGGRTARGIILPGSVGAAHRTLVSERLFQAFRSEIRKRFTKAHDYWIGPGADNAWRNGGRLADDERSPREYDLPPPQSE